MSTRFAYDGQIKRFLTQFIRMMSNFQVQFGKDRNGNTVLQTVPVYYGDVSRQAATILKGNSENALNAVPAMAVYISGMKYDQDRVQEPFHVSKLNLRQRSYDPVTGEYGTSQDSSYTVERLMPVPYTLTLKLDIWTSNNEQKFQLIEQIGVLFNPSMEIQSTDNYVDQTSLTAVRRTDINWDSRTVPTGGEESISIATLTFELPIWLSTPAKVKQLGVVQKIISSIYDANGNFDANALLETNNLARTMLTPLGYSLLYVGDTLQLVKPSEIVTNNTKVGTPDNWHTLIGVYGSLRDGISQVRLQMSAAYDEPIGVTTRSEIIGTVAYHPTDTSILLFNADIDSLPPNTLPAVTAIVDPPNMKIPNAYVPPPNGTRYLILGDIGDQGSSSVIWGTLVAKANDIIQYNGVSWSVVFDSTTSNTVQYATNLTTNVQFKWMNNMWSQSVVGVYEEGTWSIIL